MSEVQEPVGKKARRKNNRPHPYQKEASPDWELALDPRRVGLIWFILSAAMVIIGFTLARNYGFQNNVAPIHSDWEYWNSVVVFSGLGLLAASILESRFKHILAIAGWIVFGAYWALTFRDLFYREGADYVNSAFGAIAVFGTTYLAYHEWLNYARRVSNEAIRFLKITAVVAAGTYFLISKVTPVRLGLIHIVGNHTMQMLDVFGFGAKQNLSFEIDRFDTQGPVSFRYPDTVLTCPDGFRPDLGDSIEKLCLEHGSGSGFWSKLFMYLPESEKLLGAQGLLIVPVSIILACTAIQSIMLFVGLFMGTRAEMRRRIGLSLLVGSMIYILNLMRNTLVIWAYGQGHTSFWFIHNFIAKILTLSALFGLAALSYKLMPELFTSLSSVIDLKDRDGPLERALRIGRRRPKAQFPGEGIEEN